MKDPYLIASARRVLESKTAKYVRESTGLIVAQEHDEHRDGDPPEDLVLLDMQSANLLVQIYDMAEKKPRVETMVMKGGVTKTVQAFWRALDS